MRFQKLSTRKFHEVLPGHVQDEWRAALIAATHIQVQLSSDRSPADGMSAVAKNGASARPSRQLCYQTTQVRSRAKGGNVGSGSEAAQIHARLDVGFRG
jgi:hypothetical protein